MLWPVKCSVGKGLAKDSLHYMEPLFRHFDEFLNMLMSRLIRETKFIPYLHACVG